MPGFNFTVAETAELARLVEYIKSNQASLPNTEVAIRVLECVMFIQQNHTWIANAITNKADPQYYRYPTDIAKQVLRAHNNMSFHILGYADPAVAIAHYSELYASIAAHVESLLEPENQAVLASFCSK